MTSQARITCYKPRHLQLYRSPSAPEPASRGGSRLTTPAALSDFAGDDAFSLRSQTTQDLETLYRRHCPYPKETESHPDQRVAPLPTASSRGGSSAHRAGDRSLADMDRRCDNILKGLVQHGSTWTLAKRRQARLYDVNCDLARHSTDVRSATSREWSMGKLQNPTHLWGKTFHPQQHFETTVSGRFNPDDGGTGEVEVMRRKAKFENHPQNVAITKWGAAVQVLIKNRWRSCAERRSSKTTRRMSRSRSGAPRCRFSSKTGGGHAPKGEVRKPPAECRDHEVGRRG